MAAEPLPVPEWTGAKSRLDRYRGAGRMRRSVRSYSMTHQSARQEALRARVRPCRQGSSAAPLCENVPGELECIQRGRHCRCLQLESELTRDRKLNPLWLLPLLVSSAAAQLMDTANGSNSPVRTISLFDQIQDSQEWSLFKELWDSEDPQQARQRAVDFVQRYPRSVVLRQTYEVAARALAALRR